MQETIPLRLLIGTLCVALRRCRYAERECGKQIRRHVERCVSDKIRTVAAKRVSGVPLKKFGLDERGFQDILFRSLDRLIRDDELFLLLMQSRHWREG